VNSEAGVIYQLRDDADDSIISGLVLGNGGNITLATGTITADKTFNITAQGTVCTIELDTKPTVTINSGPNTGVSVAAQNSAVCSGTSTTIVISNSEAGATYELRDNATNTIISGPVLGNGGSVSLPTGSLTNVTSFNILASLGGCSAQLSSIVTVSILSASDPSCVPPHNCATVVIAPVSTKVTCGVLVPDGTITFNINPAVPVINPDGVKIEIDGPMKVTNFNEFVFTGLAAGTYTYTITYGDENNPACIKTGSVTVETSGIPDVISFVIESNEYDCLEKSGAIRLDNISGTPDVDFEYTVFSSGSVFTQGTIPASLSVEKVTISDIDLGDYEIQLSQNQQSVNGCVGLARSAFIAFSMEEPVFGCDLFIPNIFTPNEDGKNDTFFIRNMPANSKLIITNRWGKEVFSAEDYQNDWTATNIADGMYYYRLVVEGEAKTGWVEILR
jgi:gliding motility-associated-like protein